MAVRPKLRLETCLWIRWFPSVHAADVATATHTNRRVDPVNHTNVASSATA